MRGSGFEATIPNFFFHEISFVPIAIGPFKNRPLRLILVSMRILALNRRFQVRELYYSC